TALPSCTAPVLTASMNLRNSLMLSSLSKKKTRSTTRLRTNCASLEISETSVLARTPSAGAVPGRRGLAWRQGPRRRLFSVSLNRSREQAVVARPAVEDIQAGTAEEPVVPQAAEQEVVAQAAEQEVVAGAAVEAIVAVVAQEHVRAVFAVD